MNANGQCASFVLKIQAFDYKAASHIQQQILTSTEWHGFFPLPFKPVIVGSSVFAYVHEPKEVITTLPRKLRFRSALYYRTGTNASLCITQHPANHAHIVHPSAE